VVLAGKIHELPQLAKWLIASFLVALSFGYAVGLMYVEKNTALTAEGIQEQYLGNDTDENAVEMKFKKSEREIITTIHNHVLSLSMIFFVLGGLLLTTSLPKVVVKILVIEPFLSILLTFGGIGLMWLGVHWFKYIVMISGMMLTLTFCSCIILLFWQLLKK